MFDSAPRMFYLSVRNGAIAGALGFVLMLVLFYMGKHPFLFPIYFDFRFVLISVFLVITLKEYRDDYQQGILYFSQGMIISLVFTIVFALVASLLIGLFGLLVADFLNSYIMLAKEQLSNIGAEMIEQIGKETYEKAMQELPNTRITDLMIDYFIKSFIISFFLSIIISVILRKQPKTI
jgi:hypothetical protein